METRMVPPQWILIGRSRRARASRKPPRRPASTPELPAERLRLNLPAAANAAARATAKVAARAKVIAQVKAAAPAKAAAIANEVVTCNRLSRKMHVKRQQGEPKDGIERGG